MQSKLTRLISLGTTFSFSSLLALPFNRIKVTYTFVTVHCTQLIRTLFLSLLITDRISLSLSLSPFYLVTRKYPSFPPTFFFFFFFYFYPLYFTHSHSLSRLEVEVYSTLHPHLSSRYWSMYIRGPQKVQLF